MMQKRFARKGASLKALKGVKEELKQARQEKEIERKKALLCALQRDYYLEALQYVEEYVLFIPRNMEQYEQGKKGFRLFTDRVSKQYADGARRIFSELHPKEKHPGKWLSCRPYFCALCETGQAKKG